MGLMRVESPATSTDGEAIERSLSDPSWFGLVFDRHFGTIHRYLHRRVGVALADELAAETFALAFDRRAVYDPLRESARPWLYGIAANLLKHHYRTERRQLMAYARNGLDPVADPAAALDMERAVERVDASALGPRVALALASLSDGDREALLLFAWAALAYEEIAQALGIPIGTVRSRLSRARRRMRELLEATGQQRGDHMPTSREGEPTDG